ncbi:hypothetical protein GCM10027053_52090 [Intrasporangium mesophilum]
MATLDYVKGAMLQNQHEDSTFLTWGAPGAAVLPDGTFFVIAHTEFNAGYTSANPPQGWDGQYYGFQTWRLDSDLNVLSYTLYDQLETWSPLYPVPLEDYVVQVHMSEGFYPGRPVARTILFDCRDGGAVIMKNLPDASCPPLATGAYSYLYNAHVYLREFGIVALSTATSVHTYRRGQLLATATYEELGYDRWVNILGMWPHPTDPTKFAVIDWWHQSTLQAFEVTVDPASGAMSGSLLWQKTFATEVTDWVLAVGDPYADTIWAWVSDQVQVPTVPFNPIHPYTTYAVYYLRSMDGGVGTKIWDRQLDVTSNNNVTRVIAPNVMLGAVELYDTTPATAGQPTSGEAEWIAACVLDLGHDDPSAKMVGLSRRDLVLGAGVPFIGFEDIDDVRSGSQYAPAYRDGTLLLASCPVYRNNSGNYTFPLLVYKLQGAGHAEFGVADESEEWLPITDGIGPGRAKVYVGSEWHEQVTVETFDQEWKPLKINIAEADEDPIWRCVALLTPSLD